MARYKTPAASILKVSPIGEEMARLRDLIRTATAAVLSFGLILILTLETGG